MISRYNYQGLTWIDINNPTPEEISHITEEFAIPDLVSKEVHSVSMRSKVDLYDDLIYLILHFPDINNNGVIEDELEIDFIIGKDFLITVHYASVASIKEFGVLFESLGVHEITSKHGGILFAAVMKQLYKQCLNELESTTEKIRAIEKSIFDGSEEKMVKVISYTRRQLLDFKQALRFHRDILESYEEASKQFFGEDYVFYATAITSEFNKVQGLLQTNREVLSDLQNTNDSLLSTRSNEIMKTLTIMSFIMLPLTAISGIFGMNTSFIFIKDIQDFFFILCIMGVIGLMMFSYFKYRKWL